VRRTQVVQERVGSITVRIVPFPQFSPTDEQHLVRCFRERIGAEIDIVVEKVNELEHAANGKVLSVINRIRGHATAQED
jgi:hypothetical protein